MTEKHYTCACTGEIVKVSFEPEWDMIELSFYDAKFKHGSLRYAILQRWRHIRRILANGDPYVDYMDLRVEEAYDLANTLYRAADEIKAFQNARSREDHQFDIVDLSPDAE